MANLITKRLTKLPIGAYVELAYGDRGAHQKVVSGTVTDNDFSENVEITPDDGKEILLDYSIVRGVQIIKPLEEILKELAPNTGVRFSYGEETQTQSNLCAVVMNNDHEESLELRLSDNRELILNYDMVRSLLITGQKATPVGKETPVGPVKNDAPSVPRREVVDLLNINDYELKNLFDEIPLGERLKLTGAYDSFRHGVRNTDRSKMEQAALLGRSVLFREDAQGHLWSGKAVRFCGAMLNRVGIRDPEVYLAGECFREAAYAAWRTEDCILGGACAITALLDQEPGDPADMLAVLYACVRDTNDVSALRVLHKLAPDHLKQSVCDLVKDVCTLMKLRFQPERSVEDAITVLEEQLSERKMLELTMDWLAEEMKACYLGEDSQPEPAQEVREERISAPKVERTNVFGVIVHLNWAEQTGTIDGCDGKTYTFTYADIGESKLSREITNCMRSDLGGKFCLVRFDVCGTQVRNITSSTAYVDFGRFLTTTRNEDRFERAFDMCRKAIEVGDVRRALGDMFKHAIPLCTNRSDLSYVAEALRNFEAREELFPENAFAYMDVALCYGLVNKPFRAMALADRAMAVGGLNVKQKCAVVSNSLRCIKDCYIASGDKALPEKMNAQIDMILEGCKAELDADPKTLKAFLATVAPYKVIIACARDLPEEAEKAYSSMAATNSLYGYAGELLAKLRARHALEPVEEQSDVIPTEDAVQAPAAEMEEEEACEEIWEGEVVPYTDAEGWDALKLTKNDVIDYALSITGPERIGGMLAYLHAGAQLNPEILPTYRAVALAANDPMANLDYSTTGLITALSGMDADYAELNNACMNTAFLRSTFQFGKDYDFSAQALRDSLVFDQQLPLLRDACDTLEEFRREVGRPMDLYAEYRNHDVIRLKEERENTIRYAQELYQKYILTPPRDGAKFFRILKTKQIVFARDGYLAVMLRHIIDRDLEALETEKDHFITTCLNGSGCLGDMYVSSKAVEQMINESWEEAGRNMQMEKANATLQGDRRNNLRSTISDILRTVFRWYTLSEQNAGITWRTEKGEAAYNRLRQKLMDQLEALRQYCDDEQTLTTDSQRITGMFLLAATARELWARLDGSWNMGQEHYLYADFLRSGYVLLDEDFMPDLSSTFCALPEFNILARIRAHLEQPRRSFQEQIDLIYGPETTDCNYGTAARIMEYMSFLGMADAVVLPEMPERYMAHTKMQLDIRYRSFRENYALAANYGQIIKSDAFCHTLEDTVCYWNRVCRESRNYGFLASILLHAENQIHDSARQYEQQLERQLEALIARNQAYFDKHPDYAEAIFAQIANQNFTVAEDWMARIRLGDFSLEVQQPEALGYLERFFSGEYIEIYRKVADTGRSLSGLLNRRETHNRDTKRGQQLIDTWINSGHPTNPERIEQFLNLLGWNNIQVCAYQHPAEFRTELYRVTRIVDPAPITSTLHPIAAFGSGMEKKPVYVACLYGIYDCDRLYEKMRVLDSIDGNKIILLDYALSQQDRRALARKLKRNESGLRHVNMVVDRVLVTYLADHYNEGLVNRVLMATTMPFGYCQPYVVESVHTMPPEIFIGRKDELLKIEQPDGVNLIYGGRQLGKSALFKRALLDLDGKNDQRAILVDIKDLNCEAAARKVSAKLVDLGITPDAQITGDWDELCRNIERRLRDAQNPISYFLLMLDEADVFIDDCAGCGYRPLVALKDVQQSLPGQFKYVLAGLHNIVKFNRQVALGRNSVITHMPSLKITPFRTPEAQELLTGPLSYLGFSLPSRVTISQILATCNYFPGLIQLYAKKLIESVRAADYAGYDMNRTPPYVVSDEHLRRVMSDKDFVDQIREKFEITLTLDQDQGSCYYPLALLIGWMYNISPSKSGYTAREVLHHARDLAVQPLAQLDEEKIDALLQELQDLNILRSVANDSYLLASKNFRDLLGSDEEIFEKLTRIGGGN